MEKKLKTDLFRFITLRSPQLITKERRKVGFVENSEPNSSHFLKTIVGMTDIVAARAKLNAATSSFTPFASVEAVKLAAQGYWKFSLWLQKNRKQLTSISANAAINSIGPVKLYPPIFWDNLFYDILVKKNSNVRQACLQVIVAIDFVDKYKNNFPLWATNIASTPELGATPEEVLTKMANGKVVIPPAFTKLKSTGKVPTSSPVRSNYKKQKARHEGLLAREEIKTLESVRKELVYLGTKHEAEFNASYNESFANYSAVSEKAVASYIAENQPAAQARAITDSDTGQVIQEELSVEYQIPEDLVPEFSFDFPVALSQEYTNSRLSNTAKTFVATNELIGEGVTEGISLLDSKLAQAKVLASKVIRKRKRNVLLNGVVIKPSSAATYDYSFSFGPATAEVRGGKVSTEMFLSLNTGYDEAYIQKGNFTMMVEDVKFASSDVEVISNDAGVLFVKLFGGSGLNVYGNVKFSFTAVIELDNGKSLLINKNGIATNAVTSGTAVLVQDDAIIEGVGPLITGINKIGVADFRKVEQELCCYVAGEVSHIENILAKEYKEKSTRNLVSTENTLESTSEREIEELTDTASTTRHEMTTEIAEVINKDRSANLGFNASASGKILKQEYNAGIYGDFAFAQSTSDSNSSARTYAEDVTRRALERIVQKTTVKRTSRVLREYEENSKHGFDNREGENHVTGVYRWIDKIYKNRLVNYGKKLVYEFMIPEPARFYNEAIFIKADQEEDVVNNGGNGSTGDTGVAIKPLHPSENEIANAGSINRSNYQSLAALYGVSVDEPLDETVTIATSFTHSIGNTDKPKSFENNDMFVPQNYQCTKFTGLASYGWKARVKPRANIKVSAGGKTWKRENLSGTGNSTTFLNSSTVGNVEGPIKVSVNTKKITSFTVALTATCSLKSNVYGQWQQDVYDAILRAYEAQMQAFNDAQAQAANEDIVEAAANNVGEAINRNPKFNEKIVMTELRRLCIEMLMQPFGLQQGRDLYKDGKCDVPQIKQGPTLEAYAAQVKFFEQAFDWTIISYLFYPYYWADRCDWESLFQLQDSVDYTFQAFIQSGMGRVMVPVREGFEDAVVYFMETGEIWNGTGIVFDTDDDLYLSVTDEMNHTAGVVEGQEWETIVPTNLTVVQARSVLLDEEGLPCCETDEAFLKELNLKADKNTLSLLSGATE